MSGDAKLSDCGDFPKLIANWCLQRTDLTRFSIESRGDKNDRPQVVVVQLWWDDLGVRAGRSFLLDEATVAYGQNGVDATLDRLAEHTLAKRATGG